MSSNSRELETWYSICMKEVNTCMSTANAWIHNSDNYMGTFLWKKLHIHLQEIKTRSKNMCSSLADDQLVDQMGLLDLAKQQDEGLVDKFAYGFVPKKGLEEVDSRIDMNTWFSMNT